MQNRYTDRKLCIPCIVYSVYLLGAEVELQSHAVAAHVSHIGRYWVWCVCVCEGVCVRVCA